MEAKLAKLKVFAMDVDGVLTDGRIIVDGEGVESKNFNVQDGMGVILISKAGFKTAIISARASEPIKFRSQDLRIDRTFTGVYPKTAAYEQMLEDFGVKDEEVCFIGDDVTDLVIMKRAGFAVAVENAVFEIKQAADYVTKHSGGHGAVREAVELILRAQGKWGPALYEV